MTKGLTATEITTHLGHHLSCVERYLDDFRVVMMGLEGTVSLPRKYGSLVRRHAFVFTLAYSRVTYVEWTTSMSMATLERCHENAFAYARDKVLTAAILDRLLNHSVVINIRGRSYRLRDKLPVGIANVSIPTEPAIPVERKQ